MYLPLTVTINFYFKYIICISKFCSSGVHVLSALDSYIIDLVGHVSRLLKYWTQCFTLDPEYNHRDSLTFRGR
jgi:hypothetical protein